MTISSTKSVKLIALTMATLTFLAFSLISPERPASAKLDDALEQIATYRTWTKVTKDPIKGASLASLMNLSVNGPSAEQTATVAPEDFGGG